jgi:hypothetical protein
VIGHAVKLDDERTPSSESFPPRLAREFPKADDRWGAAVIPMQEEIVGDSRTMLLMLLGAVGLAYSSPASATCYSLAP